MSKDYAKQTHKRKKYKKKSKKIKFKKNIFFTIFIIFILFIIKFSIDNKNYKLAYTKVNNNILKITSLFDKLDYTKNHRNDVKFEFYQIDNLPKK